MLGAVVNGQVVLSREALVLTGAILLAVLYFYYDQGVFHAYNDGLIFWFLAPIYIYKAYLYGVVIKRKPSFIVVLILLNLIALFGAGLAYFIFHGGSFFWVLVVAVLPIAELIALVLHRVSKAALTKSDVAPRSVLTPSSYLELVSVANSSQLSMQVFLGAVSKISPEASALTALAYQIRALPLAAASSIGQVLLRRGNDLWRTLMPYLMTISSLVAGFTVFAGCLVYYLWLDVTSYSTSDFAAFLLVLSQLFVWFSFSILNGVMILQSRTGAAILAALMLVPAIAVYVGDFEFLHASVIYLLMIGLVLIISMLNIRGCLVNGS